MTKQPKSIAALPKCPTGIRGLDEITNGGLPKGRPTLICGPAGCGKTLMSMEFLVRGIRDYGENGVFMAFEETGADLSANAASLGFKVDALVAAHKLFIDHVRIERSEIDETGDYDLDGLFIRLDHAIKSVGAKRVVLDTVEALFAGFPNPAVLRAELRRLFRWLKDRGVTAIITGEPGEASLTRYGIEEYVSDCVIVLDHRVNDQMSIRRLRVAKYRGSAHGTNEYPFLIDEEGISILPLTSMNLAHKASAARIPSGIPQLDTMLGGKGYYRGSSVLISGAAGSGKTSIAAQFADAACRRGERCLFFLFEESPGQMTRNMRSIGLDLQQWIDKGLLLFHAARPSLTGLEMHLAVSLKAIRDFQPKVVIVDPISAFSASGQFEINSMLIRLIDFLKTHGMTAMLTSLTSGNMNLEQTDSEVSSLIDTWLLLRDLEQDGERNRGLYVLKSRGMAHSNQVREFRLTGAGMQLIDVYVGPAGVLTGSARMKQELVDRCRLTAESQENARKENALLRKRHLLQGQIMALQDEIQAAEREANQLKSQQQDAVARSGDDHSAMLKMRQTGASTANSIPANDRGAARRRDRDQTARHTRNEAKGNGAVGRRTLGAPAVRGG